jgi:hypothetical protein
MRLVEREPGCVLMLDIDNFKRVNDSLGHQAGDSLIRSVAGTLQRRLRAADILARLGGDEFAVLLHGTRTQRGGNGRPGVARGDQGPCPSGLGRVPPHHRERRGGGARGRDHSRGRARRGRPRHVRGQAHGPRPRRGVHTRAERGCGQRPVVGGGDPLSPRPRPLSALLPADRRPAHGGGRPVRAPAVPAW